MFFLFQIAKLLPQVCPKIWRCFWTIGPRLGTIFVRGCLLILRVYGHDHALQCASSSRKCTIYLRALDFEDLRAKRAVPGTMAYRRRVVNVLKSTKGQQMAANCFNGFHKVCQEVSDKRGKASRG